MPKRNVFVDVETSGLEPASGHVILGIGAVVETTGKKADRDVEEYSALIRVSEKEWSNAHLKALEVNGLTWERLQAEGQPLQAVKDSFCTWLVSQHVNTSKYNLVGQNPSFDLKFLRHTMGQELLLIDFPLVSPTDVRDLFSILVNRKKVKYLQYRSGENISLALGVEPEPKIHDALDGARVVRRNYLKIMELLREAPAPQ